MLGQVCLRESSQLIWGCPFYPTPLFLSSVRKQVTHAWEFRYWSLWSFLSGFPLHILHSVVRTTFGCGNLNSDPLSALPGSQEIINSFVTWMLTLLGACKEVGMPTLPPSWSSTWLLNITLLIKRPKISRQTNKNDQTNKQGSRLLAVT